jgi:hypothetical protein
MARPIKTTLPLRDDKSLRILDNMADVISFTFDRFYLKKSPGRSVSNRCYKLYSFYYYNNIA